MAYVKKENPGIMLYWAAFDALEEMVDGEAKQMLRAMRKYAQYGEEPDFSEKPSMKMAWYFMKDHIDRDLDRYEEIRDMNIQKGHKSGESRRKKAQQKSGNSWGLG